MKKLLLIPIMLILLAVGVSAAISDNLEIYYSFDNDDLSGNNPVDLSGNNRNGTSDADTNATGVINEAFSFIEGNSDDISQAYSLTSQNFTVALWVNFDVVNEDQYVVEDWISADQNFILRLNANGTIACLVHDGSNARYAYSATSLTAGIWYYLGCSFNSSDTTLRLYVNGSVNDSENIGGSRAADDPANMFIGSNDAGGTEYLDGDVDEFALWSRTLTTTEWGSLYNGGSGLAYPFGEAAADTLNITSTIPATNSSFNSNPVWFNVTYDSNNTANCSLYINGTLNETSANFSPGTGIQINFSKNLTDDTYTFYINCDDGESPENSSTRTIYFDTISPTITWSNPLSTNDSAIYGVLNSIINIQDNNLYSYYYNISYPNGTIVNNYNYSNTSLTGETDYNITDSPNMTSYNGEMRAKVRVCDGHTDQIISFEKIEKKNSELIFEETKIYMENKLTTRNIDYSYHTDRYKFGFKSSMNTGSNTFIVESPNYIDIITDSDYKGHLITGNKWIDFEGSWVDRVNIVRINNNKVRVIVISKTPRSNWNFESIGELNCNEEEVEFYSYGKSETYNSTILAGENNSFVLNITNYNASWITQISAVLVYNGTQYTATANNETTYYYFNYTMNAPNITAQTNVSFYWNYSINSEYSNTTHTQQIWPPLIDNCTTYSQTFVNFSLRDELNDTYLTGDIEYQFEYGIGDYTAIYNGSMDNLTNVSFCFSPSWGNFTTDITLQYSVSGYDTRDYVSDDFVVDNVTNTIDLFALASGLSTEITFHVTDENDKDLDNVFIEAYRWDIPTNTDKLVETEYTDSDGNAIFDLQRGSEYYSFRFYQDGDLELTTTRFKLFATTYEYTLRDTETYPLAEWIQLNDGIIRTLTYNNATDLINFTWQTSLTLPNQFCLNITFSNGTEVYGSCSSSMDNSLSYTLTIINQTYLAIGSVITDGGNTYILETLSVDTRIGWRTFGQNFGLVLSLLIFLVVGLLGIFNKNVAVIMGSLALIAIYLFGLIPMGLATLLGMLTLAAVILIILNKRPV